MKRYIYIFLIFLAQNSFAVINDVLCAKTWKYELNWVLIKILSPFLWAIFLRYVLRNHIGKIGKTILTIISLIWIIFIITILYFAYPENPFYPEIQKCMN